MVDFLEISGQDRALAQLQRSLAGQRRPHAYIFAGAEGVGRQTTAAEFAKLMLCESPVRRPNAGRLPDLPEAFVLRLACGKCPSCRTASAGTNPDLHTVEKSLARYHDDPVVRGRVMQELSIEVIRQFLIDPAHRTGSAGRGKVFIIDEADSMSVPAQNALLKTLEEPPPGVCIILICTSPANLLPTTRSRCQTIHFRPLPTDFIVKVLLADGVEQAQAEFWAAFGGGSVGRARELAGEDLYPLKRELLQRLSSPSGNPQADLAEMLAGAMKARAKKLTERDEELAGTLASRQAGQMLLGLLASVYRDALTVAAGGRRPLVHADQREAVSGIARRFGQPALAEILSQLARYERLLWRNVNPRLLWDNVAVTCTTAATLDV